jgi:hypothetical protein
MPNDQDAKPLHQPGGSSCGDADLSPRESNLIRLARSPGGIARGVRTRFYPGRHEVVPASLDPFVALLGSDPYNTPVGTGVLVPSTPTATFVPAGQSPSQFRYLLLLAREQFASGNTGARLTGIRQYAELAATVSGATFRKEITSPLWHPPDGNISWHVMVIAKVRMLTRNVQNVDSLKFRDAFGPCLLFETFAGPQFAPTAYTPPNGGRPWGKSLAGVSLGNMHDLRYRWRTGYLEQMLDIPIPLPCDVALFASVRQNDPSTNPTVSLTANQFTTLGPEDQFLYAYSATAQYGRIAGSLVFSETSRDPMNEEDAS